VLDRELRDIELPVADDEPGQGRSGSSPPSPILLGMEIEVALQYPNGRVHETVYEAARPMTSGSEFPMHGHVWRAVGFVLQPHSRFSAPSPRRLLCVQTSKPLSESLAGGSK
jgi:hypothetical protein